jgi:hypothetical protein
LRVYRRILLLLNLLRILHILGLLILIITFVRVLEAKDEPYCVIVVENFKVFVKNDDAFL